MIKKTSQDVITFKPRLVTKALLGVLSERARDIIKRRFGLEQAEGMTLEAIGKIYGITRERVRQIEDFALKTIRKSEVFSSQVAIFDELKDALHHYGGVAHEHEFLRHLDDNPVSQNHIHFLLVLGEEFAKRKEDDNFHHRWTTDHDWAVKVEDGLKNLAAELTADDLLSEDEVVSRLIKHIGDDHPEAPERAKRWLLISKDIGRSPVGEWGLTSSPNVRVRGVRDYAFLVLREQGSPMHFTEVAQAIEGQFNRPANAATCHNELIKDPRFVLVGRGMYALTEWGYSRGVVREVIEAVLKSHGPLTEREILDRVLKERYVKENTILVNLKNPSHFKRLEDGRYHVL